VSKHKDDGGAAFPLDVSHGDGGGHWNPGMSLRDWFAGQALTGVLHHLAHNPSVPESTITALFGPKATNISSHQVAAAVAYTIADAMLAQRTKDRNQ
jgi:hypothetical protein